MAECGGSVERLKPVTDRRSEGFANGGCVQPRLAGRAPRFSLPKIFALLILFAAQLNLRAGLSLASSPGPDDFILFNDARAAALVVETNEDRAVLRAAGDLAADINRVTGVQPPLIHGFSAGEKVVVIAGTLGRSKILDQLVAAGKLDLTGLAGQWESTVWQTVKDPLPGVDSALVIVGSDRRGTIFGIYEISEIIGVSPWYWWADVPVAHRDRLALRGGRFQQGPPAVKYRGIFLNDEDFCLRPWAARTFEPETKNIGPKTYAKIFELLLRLRANYLWPAMHPGTTAFNAFPEAKDLADQYGVVMGSSHCEQMLRNNVGEWDTNLFGEYNYVNNRTGVLNYWEQRVRDYAAYEGVFTTGMRGIHDGGMPGGGTEREKAARLHQIIDDQRTLLARWVNTNVARVPQIFCPYKEVLGLYRLAPNLPDDITLVWPDDNYGYVRQFSNAAERRRSGGAGVYYHISYWGAPADYLWLNSTPPALIWEEMTKAYDYGASRVWVLNVGDLKPGEVGIDCFLRLAWNPHGHDAGHADQFLEEFAARTFDPADAPEIAAILREYYRLNLPRKPEHMGLDKNIPQLAKPVFSTTLNGDEAELRRAAWHQLSGRVQAVEARLPAPAKDAFFELVGYPVQAAAAMNEQCLALTKYYAWAGEGRVSAVQWLAPAGDAHREIVRLTDRYNHQIAGGKWNYMMDYQPRNQAFFKLPVISPEERPYTPPSLRLVLEQSDQAIGTNGTSVALPTFNVLTKRAYFADVFNAGSGTLAWTAQADSAWIHLSQARGEADGRVVVSLDWAKVPAGDDVRGVIQFAAGDQVIAVTVSAFKPPAAAVKAADFVEDNHRVILEAEHASTMVPGRDATWQVINGLGYDGQAVSVFPVSVPVRDQAPAILAESPCLQYKIWLQHTGDWKFTLRALPTFSVDTGRPQRYALALDDAPPQIVALPVSLDERNRVWQQNVLRNAALTTSVHPVTQAGLHTLKIWMVDPGLVIDTIAGDDGLGGDLGFLWPAETRRQ
jgi:hypothetical protein